MLTRHTSTLQSVFRQANDSTICDQAPDINLGGKLELDKEVYMRFVGTNDTVPFYYTDDNIVDIPKYTVDNFNSVTNQLDCTDACYQFSQMSIFSEFLGNYFE